MNEQVRMVIAIVVSAAILIIWQVLTRDEEAIRRAQQQREAAQLAEEKPQSDQTAELKVIEPAPVEEATTPTKETSVRKARTVKIETPLYIAHVSEQGARLESFVLKNYRESVGQNASPKQLIDSSLTQGTLLTSLADGSLPELKNALYVTDSPGDTIVADTGEVDIGFSWVASNGVRITKKFRFNPRNYLIGYTINIQNTSELPLKDSLTVSLLNPLQEENNQGYAFIGPSGLIDGRLQQVDIGDLEEKNTYAGKIGWITNNDRYFLSSVVPAKIQDAQMKMFVRNDSYYETQYVQSTGAIPAGRQQSYDFQLYFGPKSLSILNRYDNQLAEAIYFGWFDIIAKPCLYLMNYLYRLIPNYGIAIIILTLIIKLLLWPLGSKSAKSMNEMKKLQPLMAEIREKYKDDKKKMNEELMGLYRTYKINPMGGCLPMVAQIPIFFALYRMLYEAIELRHAPFFGWINDLSAPDRLLNFDFAIPFMQPPYGIPVLTILMGASMFLQQKMQPPAGDPTQAKMMMFMPLIFTFIFINFSSGLVLYWFVSNIVSMGQQYYISKKMS